MTQRVRVRQHPSSIRSEKYSSEMLQRIGEQVEVLLSRLSSLQRYRCSIELQLALMATHFQEDDVLLLPRHVFLLVEMRGSGGVSASLDQITRILAELGYWKPAGRVKSYHRQDVYHLGKSAQRLFEDAAVLEERVRQLQALLAHIKECWQMEPETSPQEVFVRLAMAASGANAQAEVDAVVELLEQTARPAGFSLPFVHVSALFSKVHPRYR